MDKLLRSAGIFLFGTPALLIERVPELCPVAPSVDRRPRKPLSLISQRAVYLFGDDRRNAARYVRAVRYLRRKRMLLIDGAPPKWGDPGRFKRAA